MRENGLRVYTVQDNHSWALLDSMLALLRIGLCNDLFEISMNILAFLGVKASVKGVKAVESFRDPSRCRFRSE